MYILQLDRTEHIRGWIYGTTYIHSSLPTSLNNASR